MGRRNLLLQQENGGLLEESAQQTFFNTQFSVQFLAYMGFLTLHTSHGENVIQTLALPGKVTGSPWEIYFPAINQILFPVLSVHMLTLSSHCKH